MKLAWLVSKKLACFHVAFMKYIEKGKASALTWSNNCWNFFFFLEVTIKFLVGQTPTKLKNNFSQVSLLKSERESEKYLKSCMSSWFRSFCSDLYIMARSWEKRFEASYFEISVLQNGPFLKPQCVIVWDIKKIRSLS